MDKEVGVTSNGRCEVSIARKGETEMSKPFGCVACLHLRAKQLLHDLLTAIAISKSLDYPVECARLDHLAERKFYSECRKIILERGQLFATGGFVNPIHDRRLLSFECARSRDIRGDHEVLDEPMCIEAIARGD